MKEIYSSLYKGLVHITQRFSSSHRALDMGNYKVRNPIYSPNKLGNGTVQFVSTSYKSPKTGKTYTNSLVVWVKYNNGMRIGMYHGYPKDQVVKIGDKVTAGQQIYRTGNTGNSTGDHLHINVQNSKNQNIDPVAWVMNDKFKPMLNAGENIEMLEEMNIRDSFFKDIGDAKKGSVCSIKSFYKKNNGYDYYKVAFGDIECYLADSTFNKITTKPVTNLNGSKVDTCQDTVERLKTEIEALGLKLEAQGVQIKALAEQNIWLRKYEKYYQDLSKVIKIKEV